MTTRHVTSRRKKSKYEKMAERKALLDHHLQGKGLYRFRNRNNATLELPKPGICAMTGNKITVVGPVQKDNKGQTIPGSGEWDGDDYFMQCVRNRDAILVKTLTPPEESVPEPEPVVEAVEPEPEVVTESKEEEMTEEKLILNQPDQVTSEGTVEHVVTDQAKPLNEAPCCAPEKPTETLLTEDPMAGVEIVGEDTNK
jgi:hypothetical protein